ncbi:MAG: Ig-like domain repeat protein [Gemmatimonadales bacterium]|nr:Ig-like domain repeat protein [Gemmatimonadales bacterium]
MTDLLRRLASAPAVAIALGVSACGEGVVLPDEGEPATITVVSGNGQRAPAGTTLGQDLVVRVADTRDRPVADMEVEFGIETGAGVIAPATATTNSEGHASAKWRLGPGAGDQRVRAQAGGGGTPLAVSFTATATTGSVGLLELVSGDGQVGGVSSALPAPLVVRVTDGLGNPVPGVTVTWAVSGGGSIDPASGLSGDDGTVSAQRVLGPTAGLQSAQAAVEGLANPVTFTHTADASNPTSLVRVSGQGQTAPAGFQLPDSLVVRLLDDNGNGIGGRSVTWVVPAGAGAVDPVNSTTTADGYAVTRWTLGAAAGDYTINAVFSGLPSIPFTATATSDVPTAIVLLSGNSQTAPVGTTLPSPLRVRVTDANGNPVENVSVTWEALSDGSVSSTTTGTDPQGIAQVSLTLGGTPGTYTTTATVNGLAGSPVTFSSIAEIGRAARLVFLSQPTSALVGQTLPSIVVEIQDAAGNRVGDATNRVRISSSVAGTLTGGFQQDAVGGVATFDNLAITRTGSAYRLTASASGLADATSEPFDIARGATSIAVTAPSNPSVTGQTVTISYDINVIAPGTGSLTGNVQVSDGTQSCTGGINAGTGVGNCSIPFQTAGTHPLTATYSGDLNFTGSVSSAVNHLVNKANTTVLIGSLDPSTVGQALRVPFDVNVNTPGSGTPTGDVTITISGGSETCAAPISVGFCDITPQAGGNRTLTASYPGDANYNGDTDTESHPIRTETTTGVTTSKAATVVGESVTFTATVSVVAPAPGTPTGSVQFRADGTALGGPVALSGGSANRETTSLGAGSRVITAEYLPTGLFSASSGTLTPNQQVSQAATTTAVTDVPDPSNPGQTYTVTVTVQPVAPGGGAPDGSASVNDGAGGTCVATLSGGSGSCDLNGATPGDRTITATYGGSSNYIGSAGTAPHRVNNPPVASAESYAVPANFFIAPAAAQGVLANDSDADGDVLRAALDGPGTSNGELIMNLNGDGGFIYTPNSGFIGTDSFTYHATDGFANSATVTVTLQVSP